MQSQAQNKEFNVDNGVNVEALLGVYVRPGTVEHFVTMHRNHGFELRLTIRRVLPADYSTNTWHD